MVKAFVEKEVLSFVIPIKINFFIPVSTWRHIQNKPFACYAIYIDCPTVDSIVAGPILQLFNAVGLKSESKYVSSNVNESNLYM